MRIIVADCSAEYSGRLQASLPPAKRVILVKADSSVLIFSELGSYKPLNWMAAPCTIREVDADPDPRADSKDSCPSAPSDGDHVRIIRVKADKTPDLLEIRLTRVYSDDSHDLGADPGLVKDGVEDHLQKLLAEQIDRLGPGSRLVRREFPTPIGPVDIMAVDSQGDHVAVEIKRHGGIDGVEQLTRYCALLNRDPLLAPVHGVLAAQSITPQARVLAESRGLSCLLLDYEDMKDADDPNLTLF
ncbi:endonuclease NucS [uncultured Bifidobacterium sp.]|uniref:endonuclease NucS n=1 Tax=uncultured Bifidobacterium sp. TaxID=165187 RepID=UPI00260BEBC5|nr:endonuclease NucS [uncultured Bifidobacterium sp.]